MDLDGAAQLLELLPQGRMTLVDRDKDLMAQRGTASVQGQRRSPERPQHGQRCGRMDGRRHWKGGKG